ncbi:UNVERIFIED_CONTAM: putative mitochondrial protein [Sesamum latifolium]|uniref:Mitochondrial protein n=1 Tax=Sesamum latifolium TaxID=2727402 RepID=A0AAW2WEK1_9LAMI
MEERNGNLLGVAVCRQAPRVSHLLFADDTLIFCQATTGAAMCILEVLEKFGKAAGQEINFDKSSVVFSKNTTALLKDKIQHLWRVRMEDKHDLYLGLPSVVGKSRRTVFQSIRDRIWRCVSGWNERRLSQAGKEILIKAVAQAIPTYAMGCFRLPLSLLKEIQSMISNFWWHNGESRKIHWVSWKWLCTPKAQGGMGFRDLQAFNLAMLSKQMWRILTNPSSLLSRVLRARYFPNGQILLAKHGSNQSFTWRSILAALKVVKGGFRWRIGSGQSVRVWDDPWIPRPFSFRVLMPKRGDLPNLRVCDLIDTDTKDWDISLIREMFWQEDSDLILSLPLSAINGEDFIAWHYTANGKFTARSAYQVAVSLANQHHPCPSLPSSPLWKTIWKAKVLGKIRVFTWKFAQNAIPTGANLSHKLRGPVLVCPLCQYEDENIAHIFLHCSFDRKVWGLSHIRWELISDFRSDSCAWLEHLAQRVPLEEFERTITICWALWWNRNPALMDRASLPSGELLSFALNYLLTYRQINTAATKVAPKKSPGRWFPPRNDEVKINFDGAMFADSSESGLVWLLATQMEHVCGGNLFAKGGSRNLN